MKSIYLFGLLTLAVSTLVACSDDIDNEDRIIITTDKGLDIDDDKTHQAPIPGAPSTPGSEMEPGEQPGSLIIPDDNKEDIKDSVLAMNTIYITSQQIDTTLFEGNYAIIDSHIVIRTGGKLIVLDNHTMNNDATITIEEGGCLSLHGHIGEVDLTIKSGGTLDLWNTGVLILREKESLHLEPGAIIECSGNWMNNEGIHILSPSEEVIS